MAVILLCNLTAPKASAFRLTVLSTVGQIFTGVLLDTWTGSAAPNPSFYGGLIVATGMAISMFAEWSANRKAQKEEASRRRTRKIEEEHRKYIMAKYGGDRMDR